MGIFVSIPYRYATNEDPSLRSKLAKRVSIPYRYATNSSKSEKIFGITYVSIPYRYATNDAGKKGNVPAKASFNPL